jgi:ribonuclease HII
MTDDKDNKTKKTKINDCLKYSYNDLNTQCIEIGIDEVGRGPLFGRVYASAVVLPKDDSFDHYKMKDSKKFHSKKKIDEVSEYIKQNALFWTVQYEDEKTIDDINILQASQNTMHKCIKEIINQLKYDDFNNIKLLVDGNYFKPYITYDQVSKKIREIDYVCIEGGDNKFSSIAAASILAKVERDKYIDDLCEEHPYLIERYSLNSNKGYGAKKHIDGIKTYGITEWHRKSFGICKNY